MAVRVLERHQTADAVFGETGVAAAGARPGAGPSHGPVHDPAGGPLRDAAAVNSTRRALFQRLKAAGLDVEAASGGRTKWNRQRPSIPKAHCLDAVCVGHMDTIESWQQPVPGIRATGRGSFSIQTMDGLVRGIHHRFCTRIQRADGHGYAFTKMAWTQGDAGMGQASPAALSLPGLNAGGSRATG